MTSHTLLLFSVVLLLASEVTRSYNLYRHSKPRKQLPALMTLPSNKETPTKATNTLNLLTKGPPQQLFVPLVKWFWNGVWRLMVSELAPHDKDGRFIRDYSTKSVASAGLEKLSLTARYHLYLGNPCPWCHRVSCALAVLKSPVTVTRLLDNAEKASKGGWIVDKTISPDPMCEALDLAGIYSFCTKGEYQGRCTAPLLIDLSTNAIISNESNEILRLLNDYDRNANDIDLYPEEAQKEIDEVNDYYYNTLQNGVYRCGFATTQLAYEEAASDVQEGLAKLEAVLSQSKFIVGNKFTEADLKMFPFACRFDGAYSILYKAPGKLGLFPSVYAWAQRVASLPDMDTTVDIADAVGSYYRQLFMLNPSGIVPQMKETVSDLFDLGSYNAVEITERYDFFHHHKP